MYKCMNVCITIYHFIILYFIRLFKIILPFFELVFTLPILFLYFSMNLYFVIQLHQIVFPFAPPCLFSLNL